MRMTRLTSPPWQWGAPLVAAIALMAALATLAPEPALGNGGPFVIRYPAGDPSAKGALARIDPDLRPARESRLRVVKEDLKISLYLASGWGDPTKDTPLAQVAAIYTIENPTDEEIAVDFGFPILRGVHVSPFAMMPVPDAEVRLGEKRLQADLISNSVIYGIIRARARETIEQAVAADPRLAPLVATVRATSPAPSQAESSGAADPGRDAAREALRAHLVGPMKWNERDAALMVEYAGLVFGATARRPFDQSPFEWSLLRPGTRDFKDLVRANLGALSAIGEQKATQFLAQLASRFDAKAAATYEAIFAAWGGDVRERSVDLATGQVRPREIALRADVVAPDQPYLSSTLGDPTLYARVDYLDPNAKISDAEKAACRTVLKNLPVVFTFAPMNLLHYQASFAPKSTQTLTVTYRQFAFRDTGGRETFQLAYVVHPASLWDHFGPIHLEVAVPEGVSVRASTAMERTGTEQRAPDGGPMIGSPARAAAAKFDIHKATLAEKTGELLLGMDAEQWRQAVTRLTARPKAGEAAKPAGAVPAGRQAE